MAEIINLRRTRKAKARRAAETAAQANSLAFGRSKSERQATERETMRATRELDGHRREPSPSQPIGDDSPPHDDA